MITYQDAGFGTLAQDDEDALASHEILYCTHQRDELKRFLNYDAIGHIEHETILAEEGVEGSLAEGTVGCDIGALGAWIVVFCIVAGLRVNGRLGQLVVVAGGYLRIAQGELTKRTGENPFVGSGVSKGVGMAG